MRGALHRDGRAFRQGGRMKKEPPDGGSFLCMMGNGQCVGAGLCPARWVSRLLCLRRVIFFPPLSLCLRRDTFFPWRKKVSKERHLRGEGFRFPSPLKNPLTLKRPKGEGLRPLPFGNPYPRGFGDCQIAPLPQSGKGRWRPRAAVWKNYCCRNGS